MHWLNLYLSWYQKLTTKLNEPVDAASLAFFRIVFGAIMLFSQLRFLWKGWVYLLYIKPKFFFKYWGFYWVQILPGKLIYLPWIGMIICLVLIIIGKYYRAAIITFFILFSYTELLDLTNYLNHYYLITLLSFIMIFLPMNASFSLDAHRWKQPVIIPRWTLTILRAQVGLVYFFAGISKIKYDWLIRAEPLKIWLGACQNIPVMGKWLSMPITAYAFSWIGMLFDLTAPFLLLNKKTRPYEYVLIVVFHVMTLWLFYIGIFPLVMMGVALVFFSPEWHRRILDKYCGRLSSSNNDHTEVFLFKNKRGYKYLFGVYLLWQCIMPLRYLFYKGNVLWTEQGYRYSWNVMLIEKDGYVEFYVKDKITGERFIEYPKKHLTALQERMMSTQPDMILQYAHFLADGYRQKLGHPVAVYADAYVSLNQKSGKTYINPKTDLAEETDSFAPKKWILSDN
ncbi:HTTM domain-containing protein [Mucilaginibacter aquaedulcis]|uniref:HTTM domain-containing protein n=1 Tax=Mucilaginibacter aquaedulcis TaxID=1187081 RepID=UPI0025B59501|nr:HTTM domain-containing protein [Mucilaginibacter aquaedulcis]MDN3547798.1 HTTM domain-containing protein [Mucilaginibacter aquaedulcis]